MLSAPPRVKRPPDLSIDSVFAWIAHTLGTGRREIGAAEIAALLGPMGWETTFPHGPASRASVHVVSVEKMLLIRYRGSPFSARFRREAVGAVDGPRISVVELVHAGRGRFVQDDRARDVVAGDAILHPPIGEYLVEWLDDECERTYAVMSTRLFGRRADPVLHDDDLVQRAAPLLPAAVELLDVLVDEPEPLVATVASQTLYALLATTVAGAIGPAVPSDGGVLRDRARDVLQRRYAEPELDADAVARELRVSRRHLFAQFDGENDSLASTLRDIRLEHAAELLASGDRALTVRRIARESGFGGATQLARAFRARFGLTPTQFRSAALRANGLAEL